MSSADGRQAQDAVHLVGMARHVDRPARAARAAARRPRAPGGCGRTGAPSYDAPMLTRTAPTPWCPRSSLTCSNGRSTRKGAYEWTTGRSPSSASPAGDADHQLLADADVEEPSGAARSSPRARSRRARPRRAGRRRAAPPRPRRSARAWSVIRRTSATTTCGCRPSGAPRRTPRSSASWSRPSTADRAPALEREAPLDAPGQPCVDESLSITTTVSRPSPSRPASCIASKLVPSSSSASPTRQTTRGRLRPASRRAPSDDADGERQAVAERPAGDLDARDERPVGVVAERRVEAAEAGERLDRNEALGREHGVVRRRPVALGEQEPVALRIVGIARVDAEHAVVEHPEHVEGRERAAGRASRRRSGG